MAIPRKVSGCKQGSAGRQAINADLLRRALEWAIDDKIFAELKLHGNTAWRVSHLVILGVLWVWSDNRSLTVAFSQAKKLSQGMLGLVAVETYQGLTGALIRWAGKLLPLLWHHLHERMEEVGGAHWRIGCWLPLAVDGSRVSTPRTVSNEQAFCAANFGGSAKAKSRIKWANKRRRKKPLVPIKPQIWLTLLWHMGLKMPWAWKTGPSTACERRHVLELLRSSRFPPNTLFCGDAGFIGYEFWKTILDEGHQFLVRVGANVTLLRKLGCARSNADTVYLWPNEVARRLQPPLVLRLLQLKGGRVPIYVVTSVLSEQALSASQAGKLYRLRWGIELQFRSFKQTFGRGTLRSRTASCALVELEWSLLGLWIIQLFAVKEQIEVGSPPERSSVALAVGVIHELMRGWHAAADSRRALARRLSEAIKDDYQRTSDKKARFRPKCQDKPSAKKPVLRIATPSQRHSFEMLTRNAA